jgi:protein TonB
VSSQASLIITPDDVPDLALRPIPGLPRGEVVPLRPATWQPSRYQASSRPRGFALIGAGAAVAGLLAAFLSLGVIGGKPHRETLTAVRLTADLTPPPPPPPQAAPQQQKSPLLPASPIVAPPPPIALAMPAPALATSPAPAPVVIPAPAPAAAAPAAPAPAPAAPAVATGRDLSANLVDATPPRYPIDSRRAREQGTVVLNVTVGIDGRVADIGLSRSSGFDRLDRAALAAVKRWRWSPTRQNGQAMIIQGLVSIPFVLQG